MRRLFPPKAPRSLSSSKWPNYVLNRTVGDMLR